MANKNNRPGDLSKLPDYVVQELIRIEEAEKANNPERRQNEQMMQALTAATGAVQGLMQLKTGIDQNHQQSFQALTNASQKLEAAATAIGKNDQTSQFDRLVDSLTRFSREIQLKLGDVEKAMKLPEPKAPTVNVPKPQVDVSVAAPNLKPLRDVLDQRLPEISQRIIDALPEIPETDLSDVEKKLDKLAEIMREVRDKRTPIPQFPNQVKVTNPDGSNVGGGGGGGTTIISSGPNTIDTAGNDNIQTGSITTADTGSNSTAGQGSQVIWTGTPTAGSTTVLTFPLVNTLPESQSNVVIHITGTFTGTYVLERSPDNGITWTAFNCFIAGTADQINTGTTIGMFHGNVAGTTNVRVRATALTTGSIGARLTSGIGTGTITVGNPIRLYDGVRKNQASIVAASTLPVATDTALVASLRDPVGITDGTNQANVLKSDGTATGQNSLLASGGYLEVPFSTTTAQAVGTTDARNYSWVSLQITSQGTSSTVTFQTSNDGITWANQALETSLANAAISNSSGNTGVFQGPLNGRYFRLNVAGITAGTTAGLIEFFANSRVPLALNANQLGAWSVGSSSTTGAAVPTTAFYAGANNNGNLAGLSMVNGVGDANAASVLAVGGYVYNGATWDRIRSASTASAVGTGVIATTPVPGASALALNSFTNTALIGLTVVKALPGRLHRIMVQNPNTSGAWLQVFNAATVGAVTLGTTVPLYPVYIPASGYFEDFFEYSDAFGNGITVAATTTPGGNTAVTTGLVVSLGYV